MGCSSPLTVAVSAMSGQARHVEPLLPLPLVDRHLEDHILDLKCKHILSEKTNAMVLLLLIHGWCCRCGELLLLSCMRRLPGLPPPPGSCSSRLRSSAPVRLHDTSMNVCVCALQLAGAALCGCPSLSSRRATCRRSPGRVSSLPRPACWIFM